MKNLKLTKINISGYTEPPYCPESLAAFQAVSTDAHARADVALLAAATLYLDSGRKRMVSIGGYGDGLNFDRDRKGERGRTRVIATRHYGRDFFGVDREFEERYHHWQVEYVYEQEVTSA